MKALTFNNYWKEALMVLLILLCLFNCKQEYDKGSLTLANKELKETIKKSEKKISEYDAKIKDSEKRILILDEKESDVISNIEVLVEAVKKKEKQYAILEQKEKSLKIEIQKYKTNDIANYFIDRYKIQTAVNTLPFSVVLQDTVAKMVIGDLFSYDVAQVKIEYNKDIIMKKDSIIKGKDTIINIKEEKITEYKSMVAEKTNVIVEKDVIINSKDVMIKNDLGTINKQKTKLTIFGVVIIVLTSLLLIK